jgi:hypothetical protein
LSRTTWSSARTCHADPNSDNSTAAGIANNSVKQKRTKAIDWASVGFATTCAKANSLWAGKRAVSTKPTALPNTIQLVLIIKLFNLPNCTLPTIAPAITWNVSNTPMMLTLLPRTAL